VTSRFFQEALGFALTDRSKAMAFLRCNSDHHAVVLADSGVDGLNHVAFLMPEWESVMLAQGAWWIMGFPIGWGVGRHGPGNNVFSYFGDPWVRDRIHRGSAAGGRCIPGARAGILDVAGRAHRSLGNCAAKARIGEEAATGNPFCKPGTA
jgi:Glyoxalase/Bleomycin resistance protein/Dioxygenase superfamily